MYDVYSVEFVAGGMKVYGTGVYIGNGWASERGKFKHECDVELMQFTGLTDKNGVEIYEGDLITNGSGRIAQVVWHNPQATFDCVCKVSPKGSTPHGFTNNMWQYACEVIGNIHQNPELLP
jgi:uncharacterized phage protein (TIGR01671 family)